MYEGKFIQGIRNTTHLFPLHLSSLNFLDDGSGESASVGESGRISGRRERNKKKVGDSKKKNGGNKTCQGNVFNFIMDHRIDCFSNENQQLLSNHKRYSFPLPLLDYFQIKDKF